jgi:hypothetical protein
MAYDLHAYGKVFVGTQLTANNANTNLEDGFVVTSGLGTEILNQTSATVNSNYGTGTFGMFNSKTYKSVVAADVAADACCPLILASASLYANDSISPFIGGIKETNKSKYINPRLVDHFYRVDPCVGSQAIVHVGTTNYTSSLSPGNSDCSFEFLCGETYYLKIDLKGSPVLRFLNRQGYLQVEGYTGCCSGIVPEPVDSTLVMISWANGIVQSPLLSPFVSPIVYDESGNAWYAPGTNGGVDEWDSYVSTGHIDGATAGLRLIGAYVGTNFSDCTFQTTDFFEKEPVKIYASMVDLTGNPCAFTGICVVNECLPIQGMGYGETIVRELVLSEEYRQFHFNKDFRKREIEQGTDVLSAINRRSQYYKYVIIHSIPRPYNPSGVYSHDRYRLEIVTSSVNAAFETFMDAWLGACNGCTSLETFACEVCTPVAV